MVEKFRQKRKHGTHIFTFAECENPKESMLGYRWSKEKEAGHKVVIQGEKAIRKFRDWLNSLEV